MNPCFVDTFFFLALLNARDPHHLDSLQANRINRSMITTAWVLLELGDHLCNVPNRILFKQVRDAIALDRRFQVLPADQALLERAIKLYDQRPDKEWSLTDCCSFTVMREYGIQEALTGDHHFEQAGFKIQLK